MLRVVDVVVPPRLLVSGRRWFWSVLGHYRTQIGRKFLVRLEGLVAFERRGDRYPVTSPPTNRTFSLLAPQTLDPIWDSTGVDRPVIDQTGLAGMFGFTLMFSSFNAVPHVSGDPSIFTAFREQLGLKLEPARGPVELLVIDSVEQPIPN